MPRKKYTMSEKYEQLKIMLKDNEYTQKEIGKALNIPSTLLNDFFTNATFLMPLYEYHVGKNVYYGLVKNE